MNIGREYATSWRDTHLRIDGPTAREISLAFAELWNKRQFFNPHRRIYLPFRHDPSDDHVLYLRQSRKSRVLGPQHARKTIRDTYLEAFRAARSRILITNPYFLPDKQMEQDLLDAIKRGVRVEILIPERSNHLIVDLLARPVLCRILEAGGVVWLYQKTIIHSKTATIDGLWSTVGSANLDGRSLINHEINLFVNNAEFGRVMEQMWEDDLANCRKANHKDFSQPSRRRLFLEVTLSPLRPYV
jgi:cardiolipin synthase